MKRTGLMMAALGVFLLVQSAQADWAVGNNISRTSGTSLVPAIAVDSSGNPHVVWKDFTDGSRIYYNRSTDGGVTRAKRKTLLRLREVFTTHPSL